VRGFVIAVTKPDYKKRRRAVWMNILCNPTGKKGRFRAIDWLIEHNNLYTKVTILSVISKQCL
jgi:hypothetical protein